MSGSRSRGAVGPTTPPEGPAKRWASAERRTAAVKPMRFYV
jgi:hypothetical protein